MAVGSAEREPTFELDGYAIVRWPFDADTLDIFTGYAMMAQARGAPGPGRRTDFASPITQSLLLSLQPVMERHTGLALLPGRSFLRVYASGARLPRQVDGPSSGVSASLTIGYDAPAAWPLWVESKGAARPCFLDRGDMLICRGQDVPHWREPFEGGFWIQAVFHYVDATAGPAATAHDRLAGTGEGDADGSVIALDRAGDLPAGYKARWAPVLTPMLCR